QARNRSGGAGPPRRCLNARLGARLVEPRRAADFAGGMRSRLAGEGGFLSRGCVLGLRAGALATAARCFCVRWPPRLARALPTRVDVLAAGVAGLLTHVAGLPARADEPLLAWTGPPLVWTRSPSARCQPNSAAGERGRRAFPSERNFATTVIL